MTLVLTDSAVKVTILETSDGVGVLGYAGLGATPHGTQQRDPPARARQQPVQPSDQ